jgi:hypothetical protein
MKKHLADGAHARARSLRQSVTEAESRLWRMLRSHQMTGYKFRRQVPIGRYIADFVCHEARLIVEIVGGQHDRSSPRRRASDDRRRAGPHHPHPALPHDGGGLLPMNNFRSENSWRSDPVKATPSCDRRSRRLASRLSLEPSPSMGEGWEGVTLPATQVET